MLVRTPIREFAIGEVNKAGRGFRFFEAASSLRQLTFTDSLGLESLSPCPCARRLPDANASEAKVVPQTFPRRKTATATPLGGEKERACGAGYLWRCSCLSRLVYSHVNLRRQRLWLMWSGCTEVHASVHPLSIRVSFSCLFPSCKTCPCISVLVLHHVLSTTGRSARQFERS